MIKKNNETLIHTYAVKPLIYVAGAYNGSTYEAIDTHIGFARIRARELWEAGFVVICPHLNTAHFEVDCKATYEDYLAGDLALVAMCQGVALVEGWEKSPGTQDEIALAKELGIPVYLPNEMPVISPTITKYPNQCRRFWQIIGQMYRVHLLKNQDYSPANVAGPGMLGIATRMWDKATRLCNLSGIDVEVIDSKVDVLLLVFLGVLDICRRFGIRIKTALRWTGSAKTPEYERAENDFIDLSVYGVIGYLKYLDLWGN